MSTDIVKQLADAQKQRNELHASIPQLEEAVNRAIAKRNAAFEDRERIEGDHLVGTATDAALTAVRARDEAATIEHRKATATLRKAHDDLKRLDEAITRLAPEVQAQRITYYQERQKELVTQLAEGLQALVSINDSLHANFLAAENEFPYGHEGQRQRKPRPYPVAAGIQNMSWHELRHDANAADGGRLGSFLRAVDEFINPQPPAPPKRRRESPTTPAPVPVAERISAATMSGLSEESKAVLRLEGK
jgi:hypothetical protein